jgi:methylglutaconyl-CoA hydratase
MPAVLVEKKERVTVVRLNRPERRNALTIELMMELVAAIELAAADPQQRVLVLCGEGKAFCTGLDLQEVSQLHMAHASAEMVAKTLLTISQTRLVTIALVHGAAVAGGAGIMSACDFVVAAERTKFGYPEVWRGLVAGLVMTFLRRQLCERDARELLLTGELIDATRAKEIGLINRVVSAGDLDAECDRLIASLMKGAPVAISNTKRLLEQLWSTSVQQDVENALEHHMQARESPEAREGVAAFLEKRSPKWAS